MPLLAGGYRINLDAISFDLANSFNSSTTGCELKKAKNRTFGMKIRTYAKAILTEGNFSC